MQNEATLEQLKRAVKLQRLLQQGIIAKKKAARPLLSLADRTKPLQLSWGQQRLWFVDQLDSSASAAYHMPSALRLSGLLDTGALRSALDRIVARHEILRTTFKINEDGPVQSIAPADIGLELLEHDLCNLMGADLENEIELLSKQAHGAPFDLTKGPLIRGRLLRIDKDQHILFLTQHHIISDGWSISLLIQEVGALYAAFLANQPDPLPPLTIQYADYSTWQREWLQGDELQQQLSFWTQELSGAPELLQLPTDHQRPATQNFAGSTIAVEMSATLVSELNALSKRNGATLFMTLLAAWAVVLARLVGGNDIVIGTPVANRQRAEVERLLGLFVNTLALRVRLEGDPSTSQLLQQVKASTLAAYEHQDLPFEQVVEALQPTRSLSHSPLFQVMLALNNTPERGELTLPGLTLEGIEQSLQTSHLDLTLSLNEVGGRLVGTLNYASDLFDRETVCRWVGYLHRTLAEMVSDPDRPISEIEMLSDAERRRLITDLNANCAPYPDTVLVHQLFEMQARSQPDALAISYQGTHLSYAELNARANRVAHALIALGARPDTLIAICMQRSVDMIVAVLAVLKSGAAYVPLDPSYPVERLQFMLNDSRPMVLLTQSALAATMPAIHAPVLLLDEEDASWAMQPCTDPDTREIGQTPDQLAYMIYTSGSSGLPKGVLVEHRSLCNLVAAQIDSLLLTPQSRVLQFVSFSFDVCISEIAMALCSGASLHLAHPDALIPGQPLIETLRRKRISHVSLPLPALAALPTDVPLDDLHTIIVGGDVCPSSLARQWSSGRKFFNVYGPTEATVSATSFAYVDTIGNALPIGTPLPNVRIYILDDMLRPAPSGVVGEIYIGGVGVARGYWARPELNEARFLPDPFGLDADARMYKTGDLGRWLADGNLEFCGRNDFQVKIRGFRIELGEIEMRLTRCEGVRDAIVDARNDVHGQKRLVAYASAQQGKTLTAAALRGELAQALPDYMLPSSYVVMERFPLTPNGKIDRKALPAPEAADQAASEYLPPQGDIEQVVANIWQQLLGLARVGRNDHFFELGGHSLLAAQVISRLRQMLSVEVQLREIFARPILSDFATAVETARSASISEILTADRTRPLPLSWAQQRLWFLDRLDNAGTAYHMPAAMRLTGKLDRASLRKALDRVVARHEILRTRFELADGEPTQIIAPADSGFTLFEHDLRALPEHLKAETVQELSTQEMQAPFDLQTGPLIRGQLLQLSESEHVLLLTQHHIISDGWSIPLLVNEVGALYSAFHTGTDDPLPPLALQYADYAVWQRDWLRGAALDKQVAFWKTQLTDAPTLLELPTDRPRPALQTHLGGTVPLELPAPLAQALRALNQRHGTTMFMTLLAGWSIVLSRLSGQEDLVIGASIANRQRAEIEPLLGFFVNTLALRMRLHEDPTVTDLLSYTKATTLAAYEHQDVPFEQVVEAVQPVRSMSHSPLFQVMLALNNNHDEGELVVPGLSISGIAQTQNVSRFDLTLALRESGDTLEGSLTYSSDLFDRATIERWAEHLVQVLSDMADHDKRHISQLNLLSSEDQRRLIFEFNDTGRDFQQTDLLHRLFEARAHEQPDAVAVVYQNTQLTYGELNRRANQVAHALLELGSKPDARVAICLERSVEMAVAILGVLKSGAGYVPLDPTYPSERLAHMLADSSPLALLTQNTLQPSLPATAIPVIVLDVATAAIAGKPETDPDPNVLGCHPRQLAYVIYTSGSTGLPKGVMIEHRSAVNFWNVMRETTHRPCPPHARIAVNASYTFDMSLKGWLQLLSGHTLHLIPQHLRADAKAFCGFLEAHRIDAFDCTPSQLEALLSAGLMESPDYRACSVLIGGEAIGNTLWERLRQSVTTRFFNMYGPTEATIDATICEINGSTSSAHIGGPIHNVRTYLLDTHGKPVPLGIPGEIHIGGTGVARGYLQRPELSAERFLPDPFGTETDARMYKTGDLGSWRADGTIKYLGRNDFQVKIRGFRVELGEIEARLRDFPGVRDAVVVAREDVTGGKRLIAYLVAQGPTSPGIAELREHLSSSLAEFMVPSLFQILGAFPLNANGKLDRNALPTPDGDAMLSGTYEAPTGPTEIALTEIWKELLEVDRIGRNDDFFELGGHSLLAIQLIAQIQQRLATELGLRELFSGSKLRDLAATVDHRRTWHPNLAPIRTSGDARPLFLVHPGEGEVGYAHALAPWIDTDIPVYALAASGFLEEEPPHATVEEMADCYIGAMREVQPTGPYRIAGWSAGGTIAYEIAHRLIAADEQVDFLGLLDTTAVYPPLPAIAAGAMDGTSAQAATVLAWLSATVSPQLLERLEPLAAAGSIEEMLACCQDADELPPGIPISMLHRHALVRYSIAAAVRRYVLPSIPVEVHLFSAQDQYREDPSLGWTQSIGRRLRQYPVGGDHRTMVERTHLPSLAGALCKAMHQAQAQHLPASEAAYEPCIVLRSGTRRESTVLCIPGAGSSVAVFASLSQALPAGTAMHGMQARGLCGTLVPHLSVESAARAYIRSLHRASLRAPYRLLGHSYGGWIACEMACQLQAAGEHVSALVVLDTEAPQATPSGNARCSRLDSLLRLVELYEMRLGRPLPLSAVDLVGLDEEAQLALLLSRLVAAGIVPAKTRIEVMRGIVRVFCGNLAEHYVLPTTSLPRVHVAIASDDDNAAAQRDAWHGLTPSAAIWSAPGNHMTMLEMPNVEKLAAWLHPILSSN
ncbi:amino acid adenylation domain-containing protein [Xanthomonas sontii]|uniref:non-ribosomal peptide synthetase n=1 Tax=Xanthomonas sontii TaxID=2650745 RepID=UPI0011E493EF|nr:non-ribosomal peptide synthetase [Xanthomonas sontii]MDQ7758657.1 amino acid adenylation domain-containing protein [Xanthomonas sontii]TYD36109.1 hypothetical protein CEK63_06380 [Xanthomonas sontii]UZK07074.1 amino acid adenylation domain-containing protein [Xanthomonas sontii]